MDTNDETGSPASGSRKLQLPVSCDPPGPNNPSKQKAWIIFGGTGHMGRSIVKAALAHGDIVTSVGRTQADNLAVMRLAGSLTDDQPQTKSSNSAGPRQSQSSPERKPHPNLLCLLCDVRVRNSVSSAIDQHLAHWGSRLDIVANCSGFGIFGSCEDQDDADLRAQFEVNFWGTLHIVQLTLPHLRSHGGGRYLIFSSTSGALGVPGLGPFCATKYAVEGLVESMLYEIEPFDIKATLVSPGHVRRDEPEDIEEERGKAAKRKSPNGWGTGVQRPDGHLTASSFRVERGPLTQHIPAYGSFVIKPASAPYQSASSPAGHAKRVVQWMADRQPTSVVRSAEIIWQLAHCSYPPLRLLLGSFAVDSVRDRLRTIMEEIEDWKFLSFGEEIDVEKARERVAGREPRENQESSDEDEAMGGGELSGAADDIGGRDRSSSLPNYDGDDMDEAGEQYDDEDETDGSDGFDAMEEG